MTSTQTKDEEINNMSIIERHNIEKGDLCEIQVLTLGPNRALTHTRYGKYGYTESEHILFHDGDKYFRLRPQNIRSIRKVDEQHVAKQLYIGQTVVVQKYGGTYFGIVTKIGRTRVTVDFHTKGGKAKQVTLPAWELKQT